MECMGGMSVGSLCRDFAAAFLMGFLLPAVLLVSAVAYDREEGELVMAETTPFYSPVRYEMRLNREGTTVEQDLDNYLVGVVLAEMPAEFEPEALKAQAVAARTYTRKAYETGGKHGDGSVCTEPGCCQAYITEAEYLERGGTPEDMEKVRRAVEETAGLVLTYEGQLIEAVYFSCSGGSTEDAVAVWGTEYPYLKSVDSPGEENAAYYRSTVSFSPDAFAEILGLEPEGDPKYWIGLTAYTAGGSVRSVRIGGRQFTGTELRALLGLRSAAFTIQVEEGEIQITTKGYGHRVGMSQYGAEAMAVTGSTFRDILSHYYPGTQLTEIDREKKVYYNIETTDMGGVK